MASGEEGEPTGPAPVGTAPQYGDVRPVLQKHQPEIRLFRACERQEGVELSGGKRESPMRGGAETAAASAARSSQALAAWHGSPQLCVHANTGTEVRRPIGTTAVLPGIREQCSSLRSSSSNLGSIHRIQWLPFWLPINNLFALGTLKAFL